MPLRKILLPLLLLLLLLPPSGLSAKLWRAAELPMVHLQDSRRWVCNPDGILSQPAVDSIDAALSRLHGKAGIQTVVAVVEHVEGDDCYAFGMELARLHGIGDKRDNRGLIVILSTGDRAYQILTGRGMEGVLPDAICKRIENRCMVPAFKQQRWDDGMTACIRAIEGYVNGDETMLRAQEEDDDAGGAMIALIALGVLALFVMLVVIVARQNRQCPKCSRKSMRVSQRHKLRNDSRYNYYQVTYTCASCGYSETRVEKTPLSDDDGDAFGAMLGGAILGSGMRRGGGFGGGGFHGGSFGGGSFGGGGAGGRF